MHVCIGMVVHTYNVTCVFMCMHIPSFSWVNVAKNAWFAPAKRPRCYPVRVLGFDQPDFQGFYQPEPARVLGFLPAGALGVCFSSWSAGVLPARVLGFYQPECWGFTSRSAGVLPARVLRFFTSQSAGVYQLECWDFTSRSAEVFFTSQSGWGFYQPEC